MLSIVCLLIAAIAFLAELLSRRFSVPAPAPGPDYYSFWQPLGLLFFALSFLLPQLFK